MENAEVRSILQTLGEQIPNPSRLLLIGGSALALLGSTRPTIDIDFVGDDVSPSPFHKTIIKLGRNMKIIMEPVPLERFIPMPTGSEERSIHIGQFGRLEVDVADPYSIALSKLDRGFDTDIDDIVFLIRQNFVN